MKAYLLSKEHGTIQIKDTVFQPCTGERFKVDRTGLNGKRSVDVHGCSMSNAKLAIDLFANEEQFMP